MKYIIGDVHGKFEKLKALISKLPYEHPSDIIFVGDLVDRGEDSAAVVKFVRENGFLCVKGNHEDMMIDSRGELNGDFARNGGIATLRSYDKLYGSEAKAKILEDIKFFEQLPIFLEFDLFDYKNRKLLVSHSSAIPFITSLKYYLNEADKKNIKKEDVLKNNNAEIIHRIMSSENEILWGRRKILENKTNYFNIFGHTITNIFYSNEPKYDKNTEVVIDFELGYADIDTGAFQENGKLTAISFPAIEIYQQ